MFSIDELLIHEAVHSLEDTVRLLPFLFITYLIMEALEHGMAGKLERGIAHAGAAGSIVGALAGAIPQCGFSAMAATLYAGRVVTIGTLIAVFLSTSDEMIPVFVAQGESLGTMATIVGVKIVVAIVAGLSIDALLRALGHAGDGSLHIHELCERAHCHCDEEEHTHSGHSHDHHDSHRAMLWSIVRAALAHTLQVAAFILVITFVMGLVIEGVGTDVIASLAHGHPVRAVFVAALVGLIPNCAASVVICQLYLAGSLGAGALLAGLLAGGGVGLAVLFRTNRSLRENLAITILMYVIAVVAGIVATVIGFAP